MQSPQYFEELFTLFLFQTSECIITIFLGVEEEPREGGEKNSIEYPLLNVIGVYSSEGIFSCGMETDLKNEQTGVRINADR